MAGDGRVIVITGALGVLGRAAAKAAADAGWRVAWVDHAPAPPEGAGEALVLCGVDLTDAAAAQKTMDAVVAHFGRLDALLNIAGGFRWSPLADSDAAVWDLMFRMNVQTTANASRAALPALKASGDGRIVNIGALGAERAGAGMGPYAASKAGVHKLTEALAEELKDAGVTVNAVLPSTLDTPTNRADMPKADFGRWVAPEALAEVLLFLASPVSRPITGALIRVPGRV